MAELGKNFLATARTHPAIDSRKAVNGAALRKPASVFSLRSFIPTFNRSCRRIISTLFGWNLCGQARSLTLSSISARLLLARYFGDNDREPTCLPGKTMKRFALKVLQRSGLFALARNTSARMARILMYHNFSQAGDAYGAVSVEAARQQLGYLRQHFQFVSLTQLVEQLKSGRPLDTHSIALTVDDGRRNFHDLLFPLLLEFQVPATFFVVSSFIRREDWLWTDKVLWLAEQPLPTEDLLPDKIEQFFQRMNRLRPETRNAHIASLATRMRVAIPQEPPSKYAPCSWLELRRMVD